MRSTSGAGATTVSAFRCSQKAACEDAGFRYSRPQSLEIRGDDHFPERTAPRTVGAGAAPIAERIEAIRAARAAGIFTWVSVEPVVDTAEAIEVIETLRDEVDLWKVGKLNHDRQRESAIDWRRFLADVEAALGGRRHDQEGPGAFQKRD